MADFYTFGRDATRDIVDAVRRVKNTTLTNDRWENSDPSPVVFRIGKTTTNADYPTYPTSGDTFVVELGELSFTEATGTQTNTWTAYSPKDTRIAHDVTGTYWAENSYVHLALHHGRWFIIGGAAVTIAARVTDIGSTAIANTVTAETGTMTYTASNGRQILSFTADSPQATIIVHEMNGPPPRVGDVLIVTQVDGQYYIVKTNAKQRLLAIVDTPTGIQPFASGMSRILRSNQRTNRTETCWWSVMLGAVGTDPLPYGTEIIIEWFDDDRKWHIVQAECEPGSNGPS